VQADQSNHEQLARILEQFGPPDVVIDDGSHVGDHVVQSFQILFPRMTEGGIYVIEDLNASFVEGFGGSTPPGANTGIGLLRLLTEAAQSSDPTFRQYWRTQPPASSIAAEVAAVHIYAGIGFVEKAAPIPAPRPPRHPVRGWASETDPREHTT
jgi:hypothetical protein